MLAFEGVLAKFVFSTIIYYENPNINAILKTEDRKRLNNEYK